ncbi:hypothetical protein RJO76_000666 [Aeromonas veronii]|uniref:hypothetical protein n=1 Tax=Aeromonas veronii TaxID=654 RepID=UPI002231CEA9|nr:hypothetical protein [Aeromonas veronii]ELC7279643.1 hypothetical protein [Aeromonas veronii]UZE61015.1 hypothetical protein ONR73_07340 [Aeromonas veronii]
MKFNIEQREFGLVIACTGVLGALPAYDKYANNLAWRYYSAARSDREVFLRRAVEEMDITISKMQQTRDKLEQELRSL